MKRRRLLLLAAAPFVLAGLVLSLVSFSPGGSRSFQEVAIPAGGYELAGYLSEGPDPREGLWVVLAHGNRSDGQAHELYQRLANNLDGDVSVLAIDFRGFGRSSAEGLASAEAILDRQGDLDAAAAYLKGTYQLDDSQLVLVGHSLGSLQVLKAGRETPYGLVIAIGPADFRSFLSDPARARGYIGKLGDNLNVTLTADRLQQEGAAFTPEGLFSPCPKAPVALVFAMREIPESLLNARETVDALCGRGIRWTTVPLANHMYGTESGALPELLRSSYATLSIRLLTARINGLLATVMPLQPLPGSTSADQGASGKELGAIGRFAKWSKVEIELAGPASRGLSDDPNPFLLQVDVTFDGPSGERFVVPAFYDGDGGGGLDGRSWKVRFSPNAAGRWNFTSSSPEPLLNGYTGAFDVTEPEGCAAYEPGDLPNFSCVGRLEYVGERYLKFVDGPYWLKGGADDPEDFLAPDEAAGFDSKQAAVDYLASKGVNSLYILLHNVDGDDRNVWPWVGRSQREARGNDQHFDVAKLAEWEALFSYIQAKGIVLHLVWEDDGAWNDFDRRLYYREMIARFGHHNGLYWNIAEEFNENYTPDEVKGFAEMIRAIDPFDHPITVHHAGSLRSWQPFVGDERFDLSSFQTQDEPQNGQVVSWLERVEDGGRIIPLSFDETGKLDRDERDLARHIVWSVYLGGGNFELHTWPLEDYRDFDDHFGDMALARQFVESLPFWQMRPANELIVRGTGYVFAASGEHYLVYLPEGGNIALDLADVSRPLQATWFNPRTGEYVAPESAVGGELASFAAPFAGDAVLHLKAVSGTKPAAGD